MLRHFIAFTVAAMLACTAVLRAETSDKVDQFSYHVANAPQDGLFKGERMRATILRWSTDEERQRLTSALSEPKTLLESLGYTSAAGYLQWPGGTEYTVRYARRAERPDGGSDVILIVERPLWLWWDKSVKWDADQRFTVVHLRLGKDGKGEGRIATGSGFVNDTNLGITLSDMSTPVMLTDVRREAIG